MTSFFKEDPDLNLTCLPSEVSPTDENYVIWLNQKKFALEVWCQYWLAIDCEYSQLSKVPEKKVHFSNCLKLKDDLSNDLLEILKLQTKLVPSQFLSYSTFRVSREFSTLLKRSLDTVAIRLQATLKDFTE